MDEQTEEGEDRPWELPGNLRRDYLPHRAWLLRPMGMIAGLGGSFSLCVPLSAFAGLPGGSHVLLFSALAGLLLGVPVWVTARQDLAEMESGIMDPSGKVPTQEALQGGQWGVILGVGCLVIFASIVSLS